MNRNDKLIISYGLLVDTADAIRAKKGTSTLISPTDFPSEIESISGGGESPALILAMTFANNRAGNSDAIVTLSTEDANYDGNYDLYWADNNGIMENYTKLNILTPIVVEHGSGVVFDKFNSWNAIPKYATKLVAVLSSDANKEIKATFNIPSGKLWASGNFGTHIGSIGVLADVHYQYETGSEDWGRCFTYLDQRESIDAICIAGDLTDNGLEEHLEQWKTARDTYAINTPVYASNGNHEAYNSSALMVQDSTAIRPYLDTDWVDETEPYFSKTIDGIPCAFVPIFVGVEQGNSSVMFSSEVLAWLEDWLEEHRNQRTIIFAHCPPQKGEHPYGFADLDGKYDTRKMWGYGGANTMQDRKDFLALLAHYKNTIWISGHTHLKYQYHESAENFNICRYNTDGAIFIHTSSLTVPRDIVNGSISNYIYAESEGTIIDIYTNCLRVRTRNYISEKFHGLEEYIIDTEVVNIPSSTKELDSISASKTVVNYTVGDTLDTSDITTVATFTDTTTQTVQGSYNTSNVNMLVAGTYTIVVSYTFNGVTKTDNITITVTDVPVPVELYSISATKTKTTYAVNETLNLNDITVQATYSNAQSADVTSSAVIDATNVDTTTAGTYTIYVSYTEDNITKNATITITVSSSVNMNILLDASFAGELTGKSKAITGVINDSKGGIVGGNAVAGGSSHTELFNKPLYYRLLSDTGISPTDKIGLRGGVSNSASNIPDATKFTDYSLTSTTWQPLLLKIDSSQAFLNSDHCMVVIKCTSSSTSTATFPVSVDVRVQIGYMHS